MKREDLRVLVIGQGGREHALAWKAAASPRVSQVYAAPGNPGIAKLATCVPIPAHDIRALGQFALEQHVDLTVVGPEMPLALGMADEFKRLGLPVFGPTKAAAAIETSKVWAKEFMTRHGIPTADYRVFGDECTAGEYVREHGAPVVVKADGLAAGKGVVVASTLDEAEQAVQTVARLGAGNEILVEDLLAGEELSFFAVTDGETAVSLVSARDHKRAWDGDTGPNTGGMGAVAPAPGLDASLESRIMREVIMPAVKGLAEEGRRYTGVLYAGLMLTTEGPMVLEFNARFGDPEAQVLFPMMESDIMDVLEAAVEGHGLNPTMPKWREGACACVVVASEGYPGKYRAGEEVHIDEAGAAAAGVLVFHAGTRLDGGKLVTSGGRVLGLVATGASTEDAVDRAYQGLEHVRFRGMWCRRDIGRR
ncbi:MAG: phosphoribosylamine--glycine ligase [Bacillota bacterium]